MGFFNHMSVVFLCRLREGEQEKRVESGGKESGKANGAGVPASKSIWRHPALFHWLTAGKVQLDECVVFVCTCSDTCSHTEVTESVGPAVLHNPGGALWTGAGPELLLWR